MPDRGAEKATPMGESDPTLHQRIMTAACGTTCDPQAGQRLKAAIMAEGYVLAPRDVVDVIRRIMPVRPDGEAR